MRLKIGDKVKVLSDDDCFISKDSICEVINYDIFSSECVKYVVNKNGNASAFKFHELELINEQIQ